MREDCLRWSNAILEGETHLTSVSKHPSIRVLFSTAGVAIRLLRLKVNSARDTLQEKVPLLRQSCHPHVVSHYSYVVQALERSLRGSLCHSPDTGTDHEAEVREIDFTTSSLRLQLQE